jgi:opacity protein-like surface antigen
MKSLLLAAALSVLALPAVAQTQPDLGRVTITGEAPKTIELPANYSRMWAGEFDNLQGAYDLSNGDTMAMTKRINRKFIQVGDGPRTEVIAVGDYDFVSLNQKYRVVLSEPVHGEVTGYLLIDTRPLGSRDVAQSAIEVRSFRFAMN